MPTSSYNSQANSEKHTKKCECVPSGKCHSHTLTGCPHSHYFDNKGIWRCVTHK